MAINCFAFIVYWIRKTDFCVLRSSYFAFWVCLCFGFVIFWPDRICWRMGTFVKYWLELYLWQTPKTFQRTWNQTYGEKKKASAQHFAYVHFIHIRPHSLSRCVSLSLHCFALSNTYFLSHFRTLSFSLSLLVHQSRSFSLSPVGLFVILNRV